MGERWASSGRGLRAQCSLPKVLVVAIALALFFCGPPAAASAAECTDTWTGAVSSEWDVAENWSAEHVPTAADVACIPKEKTAQVVSGTHSVEVLQGEGRVTILAGSLAILGPGPSHINKLHLSGGALKGPGELLVTEFLNADGGSMEGAGITTIGAEASGHVAALEEGEGPGLRLTHGRQLIVKGGLEVAGLGGRLNVTEAALLGTMNEGKLTLNGPEGDLSLSESADLVNASDLTVAGPEGRLVLNDKSSLTNSGDLVLESASGGLISRDEASIDNSGSLLIKGTAGEIRAEGTSIENSGTLAINAAAGRILGSEGADLDNSGTLVVNAQGAGTGLQAGSGAIPQLTNTGTVLKDEGSEMSYVGFKVDNENLVETKSGGLAFIAGGNSGQESLDSWVAAPGAQIVFALSDFTFGETVSMAGAFQAVESADLKGHQFDAEEAQIGLAESDLHVTGAGKESRFGEIAISDGGFDLIKNGLLNVEVAVLAGGSWGVGEDGTAAVKSFYQEGGATSFGPGSNLTITDAVYFEAETGTFSLGAGSESQIPLFFQEGGDVSVGAGSSVNWGDTFVERGSFEVGSDSDVVFSDFYIEESSATLGSGASVTTGDAYVEDTQLSFDAAAQAVLDELFLNAGSLELGAGAKVGIREADIEEESIVQVGPGGEFGASGTIYFEEASFDIEEEGLVNLRELYLEDKGLVEGAGSLVVDELSWEGGSMSGGGQTVVNDFGELTHRTSCSSSGCVPLGTYKHLEQRHLVTNGFFSLGVSTLGMANGAVLVNNGEFDASSEATEHGAQIQVAEGSTADPKIVNKHEFNKESGGGTTEVTVPFLNHGSINQFSGTLRIVNRLGVRSREKFGNRCYCGDPIETATGDFTETQTDLAVGGRGVGLLLARTYSAQAAASAVSPGPFGYGWFSAFRDRLEFEEGGNRITLERSDGSVVPFTSDGKGSFDPPVWSEDTLSGNAETGYVYKGVDQIELHFGPGGRLENVVDRNGNETTLAYTGGGRLETIEDPAGRQITFSYNGEGLVESAEDPMGHAVQYGYEDKELVSVTMPGEEDPRWQFDYDSSHRMTKMVDGRGGETLNEYDAEDRTISQIDPAGRALSIEYGGFHTRFTHEATGAVTDQWFNSDNQPTSITRGYGTADATTETFSYDEAGRRLRRTDGNGHTTTYGYDSQGNRTSEKDAAGEAKWAYNGTHDVISATSPKGETTTIERDPNGNVESISRPAPGGATQTTTFSHDSHGQLKSVTDPLKRTWTFGYDGFGNRTSETDPLGHEQTTGYDENSRLVSIVSPRGNVAGAKASDYETVIERDARGRPVKVTDPLGHATEYAYDGNGNLTARTDAKGRTTKYAYNAVDERTKVEKPNGAVLETEYNGEGYVTSQTDGNGETTTYVPNVLGQPIEVIDPLGRKTTREFDDAGNLVKSVDPAKRETSYSYDAADRLTGIDYSSEATPDVGLEYDPNGHVIGMVDGTGESSFDYDQLGRLTRSETGHGDVVEYGYDLAGQLTGIVYPNGKSVSRSYDAAARLEKVTDWLGGTTSFSYDADSNLQSIAFPGASGNVDEYGYDRASQMTQAKFKKGSETLASLSYVRDQLGQVEEEVRSSLPGPEKVVYGYDEHNRLVKAGSATFGYDLADNMTSAPGRTSTYDKASQLEASTAATYSYNQMGERTSSTTTRASTPAYGFSFGGETSGPGRLSAPAGIAIDSEGNAWVADTGHNRIQQFDAQGEFIRQIGTTGSNNGQFNAPRGLAIGPEGNLFVADTGNHRIQVFKPNGEFVRKFGTQGTGNGQFSSLKDIAIDPEGKLWALESTRIQRLTLQGAYLSQFGTEGSEDGQLKGARGIATDAAGNVWIADTGNQRIQAFKPSGEFIRKFGSQGIGNGKVKSPHDLTVDAEGNLWVADTENYRLEQFSPEGAYLSQLGTGGPNDGQFALPQAVTIDAQGDLWVADTGNDRIQEVSATEFLRQFGGESSGSGNLSSPAGVAIDGEGNVWVADTSHHRVQQFSPKGEFIRQFGTFGSNNGQFNVPRGIALGPEGNLFVADTGNHRVQVFKPNGDFVRKFGTQGSGNGQFVLVRDLAFDSEGNLWTVESARVQKFTVLGAYQSQFGTEGSEDGQLKGARGIATDAAGNVWIADTGNNRIQAFKPNGEFIRKFGSTGEGSGQLRSPQGLVFDSEGNVWVVEANNYRLQRFSPEGTYLAQFGAAGPNPGEFAVPQAVATDAQGDLWIADTGNNRVQEATATEFIRQFGGQGSGSGRLAAPAGVAIDSEGNAWVADTGHNRIQQFNAQGEFIRQFGTLGTGNGQLNAPRGIALGLEGNLFVADTGNNRVQVFKPNGDFVRKFGTSGTGNGQFTALRDIAIDAEGGVWTVEGSGARVQKFTILGAFVSKFGSAGTGNGQFSGPRGIATDAAGNVWVADTGNHRVQAFKPNGEFIRTFGSQGIGNGKLKFPSDLIIDSEGDVWVADTENYRVERFSSEGAYLAQFGTSGPNGGQFALPLALTTDAQGDLWVADTGNDRVQAWNWQVATDYSYNQAGTLTSVQRPAAGGAPPVNQGFTYDGGGLMASKTSGSTTHHLAWDLSAPLPLLLNDGANSYVYGPHDLPIMQISEGKPTYLHHDQIGSTRLLTDDGGKATATYSYQPFGGVEEKNGAASTPLGFAGQYTDAATGLQYLRARFYDPTTAHFLTRDPIESLTGEPYVYGFNNPLGYRDPSGLAAQVAAAPICFAGAGGALICAGAGGAALCAGNELCRGAASEVASQVTNTLEELGSLFEGDDDEEAEEYAPAPYDPSEAKEECPTFDRNPAQDKKVTDRELKEAGLDAHQLKRGNRGTDIYKDRDGNLYEKPQGGRGPGDPLGINIKDLLR